MSKGSTWWYALAKSDQVNDRPLHRPMSYTSGCEWAFNEVWGGPYTAKPVARQRYSKGS